MKESIGIYEDCYHKIYPCQTVYTTTWRRPGIKMKCDFKFLVWFDP